MSRDDEEDGGDGTPRPVKEGGALESRDTIPGPDDTGPRSIVEATASGGGAVWATRRERLGATVAATGKHKWVEVSAAPDPSVRAADDSDDSEPELADDAADSPSEASDPVEQSREDALAAGDHQRTVELRLVGITGSLWTVAALHAGAWAWATDLVPTTVGLSTWAAIIGIQLAAFYGVTGALIGDLPKQRWAQRGAVEGTPALRALYVTGFIALPVIPLLLWRARKRRGRAPPTRAQLERASVALAQLPRVSALRLLTWASAAYVVDAVVLGVESGWPRELTIALALLWVALVGPVAAIAFGWARAILRPETQIALHRPQARFERTHDLRIRLVVSASIASTGAILAPLAAGYLWLSRADFERGDDAAQLLATEAALSANDGDGARLTALLADNPSLTVIADGQAYGAMRGRVPIGQGLLDEDADGVPDTFVVRDGRVTAVVPLAGAGALPLQGLLLGGFACLACCVVALSFVAADLVRDVERANEQVKAVAEGRAPPPMSELSLSSLEIRDLVQAVDRLVGRITEANVAKYIAIEHAKEADRLKSQFLANMSHDLRSPLNSILGFSELLISGIDGDVTDEQKELLQEIHDSGRHLLQQIDDILDTAKIEAGRLDLHPEPTPPATLLTRAIQNAKRRGHAGIEFTTEFAAGLPPAFIDPYRGVQALENVLLFAGERMSGGTIDIRVRRGLLEGRRMISVVVRTPARPATTEQLGQARRGFYRIPGHRGLGLGLPIAGSILELSGGVLAIEDFGDGMEFGLMFPAPEARRAVSLRVTGANARATARDDRADPDDA